MILSSEGTTQGDPIAMPLYALGVLPLLKSIATTRTVQAWFADDAGAGGKRAPLRSWWSGLTDQGPSYGYHLTPSKSVLFVPLKTLAWLTVAGIWEPQLEPLCF